MPAAKKYKIDDIVYAKWPGSSQYYKAIIVEAAEDALHFDVKFESDDSLETVPKKHLMTQDEVERVKSPARRSRSRSASSSRRRSRSRSPSRRKLNSPAKQSRSPIVRQPRSPGRPKSPARSKSPRMTEGDRVQRVRRIRSERSVVVSEEAKQTKVEEINSQEIITSSVDNEKREMVPETILTKRTTRSVTRALEQEIVKPESKTESCSTSGTCQIACNAVFLLKSLPSLALTLIGLVMPAIFLYWLFLSCKSKKSCTFLALPVIPDCSKFFSWKATSIVFGWYIFQMVLYAIPLGRVVNGPVLIDGKSREHCLNGLSQFVISMATLGGLLYYGKLPVKYLTVNYLSLITAASIFSFLISAIAFLSTRNSSSKEPSRGVLNDFMNGRSVSPRIGNFDIKVFGFKAGLISWVALNIVFTSKKLQLNWKNDISLLGLVIAQGLYVLDKLCSEEQQLHTASLKKTKIGYFSLMTSLTTIPFFCSLQARYLSIHQTTLPSIYYIIPFLITVCGFSILIQSRNQKFLFRKNKFEAVSLGWQYIITRNGKGILCDGWWSQLTHPNYFGDILQAVGWALVCGTHHMLPWMNLCLRVPMILCMANEDDKACQKKYDSAWTEYRERVKYRVFKYVY